MHHSGMAKVQLREFTPINLGGLKLAQVYAIETSYINGPELGRRPGPSERQDATNRTEVILSGPCMELIQR